MEKLRQIEWETCNFLWRIISELAFLSLWYQTFCNPASLDPDQQMETLWWSFWQIWCRRFFLTITISVSHNWDQRGRIRERIVFDSQHQIVFQLNFYFCTVRPGIDLQKSVGRIFLLTLKTSACPWKSGILSPKLGKNPTILVKNIQNWANLPPGRGPQIRNDISPPAFRFCSVSNFKSRKVDFLPKISGVFPVFSSLLTDI